MKITKSEIQLALIFAALGLIFSMKSFLMWLDKLNPVNGFIAYYIVVYASVFLLAQLGLTVFNIKIKRPLQVLGTVLIVFSFFLIFNWTSPWVQYATTGHLSGASNVYTNNSEDGLTWYLWSQAFPLATPEFLRILTFIVTPGILTLIGGMLVEEKIRLL